VNAENTVPEITLRGFTYQDRPELMADLGVAVDLAGGWILERRTVTATAMQIRMELQATALTEVYAALLASGLELTRDSHRMLAQRCNCVLLMPPRRGNLSLLQLDVEIHFLDAPPEPVDVTHLLPQVHGTM